MSSPADATDSTTSADAGDSKSSADAGDSKFPDGPLSCIELIQFIENYALVIAKEKYEQIIGKLKDEIL